jgi:hypothetical protein
MTHRDEDRYAVVHPGEDAKWTSADVLGELMAGAFEHGAWVRIHGVDLRLGGSSHIQNVWYVHPPDGDEPIEVLNLGAFRTASALEDYLKEFDPANPSG